MPRLVHLSGPLKFIYDFNYAARPRPEAPLLIPPSSRAFSVLLRKLNLRSVFPSS